MATICRPVLTGVFPSLKLVGGIQASGREAWRGIVQEYGEKSTLLFDSYTDSGKARAVLSALRNRTKTGTVLVWHLNLLPLVPFLTNAARSVVFLHGVEAWRPLDGLTEWALRKTDLILANSGYTWDRFVDFNPRFRAAAHAIVHLGVANVVMGAPPSPSSTPIALMLGRMARSEAYKGHRQMIEAWPRVIGLLPQAQLWIAGDGDLRKELESLARSLGLEASVRFHGPVSDEVKERLLQQARCLALPSRGEGFGLVYLEAMRAGRPCLVSDRDAGREVVDPPRAGLAVDPGNRNDIADALAILLGGGAQWEHWSAAARTRYESTFTAAHFHKRLNASLEAA